MLRILLVSTIRLYRDGLADVLSRADGLVVVGTESDYAATPDRVSALEPDVVLLEVGGQDSYAAARAIAAVAPRIPVVALGVGESEAELLACVESGFAGSLTRNASIDELISTVTSVCRGELICTPNFAGTMVRRIAALTASRQQARSERRLTTREREIVRLIREDLSNKEIAVRLGIEVATVKNHVHNVLEKLQVHRRSDAVRVLRDLGDPSPPSLDPRN